MILLGQPTEYPGYMVKDGTVRGTAAETTNPHIFKARFSWVTELENIELNIISNITTNSPSFAFLHGITVKTHERVVIN